MLTSYTYGYFLDYLLWWVLLAMLLVHTWCFFHFFPRKSHPRSGLVLGNILVLFCLLGVAGIIGESYFRFVYNATDSFGMSLPSRRWFLMHTKLNSFGCRDKEWTTEEPPGIRRIAFVGDSFTYGWGVEDVADRFTERLQRKFDARDPGRTEVFNVARPGWGTQDQKIPVDNLVTRFDVDEIVLCYVPNDIEKRLPRDETFDPIRPPEPVLFDPDRSCLLDFLYRRIWVPRVPTVRDYHDWLAAGFEDPVTWDQHQRDLGELAEICRDHDRTFRVVLLPFLRTGGTNFDAKKIHNRLKTFFSSLGVSVADLLPVVQGHDAAKLVVNAGDAHPNATAHALFAEAIWQAFYASE